MLIQERQLSGGWYPQTREGVEAFVSAEQENERGCALAVMAPHAGWTYSGAIALAALERIPSSTSLIILMGGHLGPGDPLLYSMADAFDSPSGPVWVDRDSRDALLDVLAQADGGLRQIPLPDPLADNSLEVFFPFFPVLFPKVKVLAMRVPPSTDSFVLGRGLARVFGRQIESGQVALVASTDLTHYGPSYGLDKNLSIAQARSWVHESNDRPFLDAVLEGDAEAVLLAARRDRSACSAGAVAAAVSCMNALPVSGHETRPLPRLFKRGDSLERGLASSFVSYAALSWER